MTGNEKERWHVGKEIPLAIIVSLMLQTGGVVWWASSLSTKMDLLSAQVFELKADKSGQNIALLQQRDIEFERRVTLLENRIKR